MSGTLIGIGHSFTTLSAMVTLVTIPARAGPANATATAKDAQEVRPDKKKRQGAPKAKTGALIL